MPPRQRQWRQRRVSSRRHAITPGKHDDSRRHRQLHQRQTHRLCRGVSGRSDLSRARCACGEEIYLAINAEISGCRCGEDRLPAIDGTSTGRLKVRWISRLWACLSFVASCHARGEHHERRSTALDRGGHGTIAMVVARRCSRYLSGTADPADAGCMGRRQGDQGQGRHGWQAGPRAAQVDIPLPDVGGFPDLRRSRHVRLFHQSAAHQLLRGRHPDNAHPRLHRLDGSVRHAGARADGVRVAPDQQ